MDAADPRDDASRLQDSFAHFARVGSPEDPIYVLLAQAVSHEPRWAAMLLAAPPPQRSPTLWFAALHDRLIELRESGATPALAAWYPSLGGTRSPDAHAVDALAEFLETEALPIRERIANRSTQTNEIGRCAVLSPLLPALALRNGRRRVALLDVGSSAGLNLGVDRWRYRYFDIDGAAAAGTGLAGTEPRAFATLGPAGAATPCVETRVLPGAGRAAFAAACRAAADPALRAEIVSRLGIDPSPIDLNDAAAVRWLRACLWPYDVARRARFDAAAAVARAERWPLCRVPAERTTAAVGDWVAGLPPDVQPVVFNSWVLAYFPAEALEAHVAAMTRWVAGLGVAWISAESLQCVRRWWPDVPQPERDAGADGAAAGDLHDATLWTVATQDAAAGVRWTLAARSHAHGRWLQWTMG